MSWQTPEMKREMKAAAEKMFNAYRAAYPDKTNEELAQWLRECLNDHFPKIPKNISPELKKMIHEMYKSVPLHSFVYPPEPKKGAILVPTGGLTRCQCRPDCTREIPIPAYREINMTDGASTSDGLSHNPKTVTKKNRSN